MKNSFLFFLGVFACMAFSWCAIVLGSSRQLGGLEQHFDSLDAIAYPQAMDGQAAQGQQVYASLGCAECHTQQVRRPGFGFDKLRGWGERQSVARDYMLQNQAQLGLRRRGPDLTNFGERAPKAGLDRAKLLKYLQGEHQPAFPFLFESRKIQGAAFSDAVSAKPASGVQVLAMARAESLVSYLLSLKQDYVFPEAQPLESEEGKK